MKNLFYPLLFATALVSAACSNDLENDGNATDPSNKTAISFVGEDNAAALTRYGFAANTHIAMHIRSNKNGSTTDVRETRTVANALADATQSDVSFSTIEAPIDENVRYWDDAYGRSAQLSVFAVAVPGKGNTLKNNSTSLTDLLAGNGTNVTWSTGALSEEIAWTVSADQSGADVIANEDLTYSNNISANGKGGAKSYNYTSSAYDATNNGCLQFRLKDANMQDGPGKFDQGNLKFNHALSRITVNLVKGTGYGESSFSFAKDTNIKILNVPTAGKLDIEQGTWANETSSAINKMATTTTQSGAAYSLMAQMLPGYTFNEGSDVNVLEFVIDDNKYFITQGMMLDALNQGQNTSVTSLEMAQGKNYVFTITVGKSKIINVTATLEPWVDVEAANKDMDNSHIELSLFKNNDGTAADHFDLYRLNDESAEINTGASEAKNWNGNYTDKAGLTQNGNIWTTDWFFENNKSFYHFRTVNEGTKIEGTTDNAVDDYFVITSGTQADHDYHWGAPFLTSTTSPIQYSKTEGYAATLSPAIGATNSTINMTELHMMSNINVVLRTTKTSNAVALEDNGNQCEVSLTYFYANGQVKMGNGLVTTTGNLTTSATFTAPTAGIDDKDATYNKTGAFTFAVVPQALTRATGDNLYVGITIKTPDNNQYYVVKSLSDINATTNGGSQNQSKDEKVVFWYPNHNYTYTFTLTKAGISNVTCTVEKWVNVTADNKDISLED
ncbi:fimbrillin family protein [Prevotella communis]|uniref:fimbrillin family protein n=1 Tax=Prevotella communis TaxID=2913614 RepID=UPI001EDA1B74|nr:fimbrillin family protein [Prevotella communis]UKK62620.1 fimbrillin family protein [Prevotella communis]UKK65445.1 fimbrillin family protein [Prevotella communis]